MALAMLAEGDLAVDERRLNWRELRGSHVFFTKEPVDRPCRGSRHETAFRIDPSVAFACGATANKDRTRSAERDQLMRIDRKVAPVQRPRVFEEVAGHPVILAGTGHVLDNFSPIAPMQLGPPFA